MEPTTNDTTAAADTLHDEHGQDAQERAEPSPGVIAAQALIERMLAQQPTPDAKARFLVNLHTLLASMFHPQDTPPPLADAESAKLEKQYQAGLAAQAYDWTDAILRAICHHDLGAGLPDAIQGHWRAAVLLTTSTDSLAARTGAVMALDCLSTLPDLWPTLLQELRADLVDHDDRLELLQP